MPPHPLTGPRARAMRFERTALRAIAPAVILLPCWTMLHAQSDARAAIAALHKGDPQAHGQLLRCGDPGLRALLQDIRTQIADGEEARASADLRALGELRIGKEFVIADLLELHDELPREPMPGLRVRVLHALADVALWADDGGATLVGAWLAGTPRSALDSHIAARAFERFYFSEERERVRARFEVRRTDNVEDLVARLADADLDIADAAAEKLARLGPLDEQAAEALAALMDAQPPAHVERILVFDGQSTEGRIPLRHGLPAARALVVGAPGSPAAPAAHGCILEHGDSDERVRSAMALRGFATVPAAVLQRITRLAEQLRDASLRREALMTLIAIGGDAAETRTVLEGVVANSQDRELVGMARQHLARMPADPSAAATQALELYAVTVDGKAGFIDADGRLAIEPQFDKVYAFREGLAPVQIGRSWGYIDTQGRMVIEPRFAVAGFFSEGRASFRMELHEPWGYIDTTGEIVIEPRFDTAAEFRNGVARVGFETDRSKATSHRADAGIQVSHRYIDREGAFVPAPDPLRGATGAPDERILFEKNGRWGFLDSRGKVVIEPRFAAALPFVDGRACARLDGLFGFIDETGRFVIEPRFPFANSFAEGWAGVPLGDKGWGFIDRDGHVVVEPRFDWIYGGFRQGLAEVLVDGAVGYIDKTGRWVWKPSK